MTTTTAGLETRAQTPTDHLLNGALLAAPLIYLAADAMYAARGWDDAAAGLLHVLGAIAYGFVVLRVASWLPRELMLAAAIRGWAAWWACKEGTMRAAHSLAGAGQRNVSACCTYRAMTSVSAGSPVAAAAALAALAIRDCRRSASSCLASPAVAFSAQMR